MSEGKALKLAIDLLHVPSRVRHMRTEALPDDVLVLLEIAAGDSQAMNRAADATGRSRDVLLNAAAFFIEQIMFAPDSDSYRVLGGNAQTTSSDLRRNMVLLLRWLHPDVKGNSSGNRSVFAGRVTLAWEDLKTAERRATYDELALKRGKTRTRSSRGGVRKRTAVTPTMGGRHAGKYAPVVHPPGRLWRVLLMLFGAARH
jgi:hypothetical protein